MQKRIEYIDLAKGFCILLVVIGHCGVPIDIPGLEIVRMPLYFALSGLFYKDYGGIRNLIIRKTNKLLVPFLFFYLIAYVIFYLLKYFAPGLLVTSARGIMDLFTNRQFFNGPLWFLLALFWCNIYYYFIRSLAGKREIVTFLCVISLGAVGFLLGREGVFIPLFMDVALTAMPFFYFGVLLKKTSILIENKYDKYNILWLILLYSASYAVSANYHFRLSLHYNQIEGFMTYLLSITSVLFILLLCKMIKKLPIISYAGRYSIILLCTHHLFYRPIKVVLSGFSSAYINNPYVVAAITIVCCLIVIPLCIRYIPQFVAQKDLIKGK